MARKGKKRRQFEEMTLGHLKELYAVAMRYTGNPDDAQDLVQDTYLRAYGAWDRFKPGSNCRAWLLKILVNGFINTYRRKKSYRKFAGRPGDEAVTAFYGEVTRRRAEVPEESWLDDELSDEVTGALQDLSEDYRIVVLLADLEGMRYKDVADTLGIPVGTVMSRLFRARRQLEARLSDYAERDYGISRKAA